MSLKRALFIVLVALGLSGSTTFATMDLSQLSYRAANESDKTANIRLDPLSILARGYALSVDAPMGRGWTLGPSIFHSLENDSLLHFTGNGIGVTAAKFFNGKPFRSGWFAGPLAYYVQGEGEVTELGRTPMGFELGARSGYQWMWNRYNFQAGARGSYFEGLGSTRGALLVDLSLGFVL